MLNQDGDRHMVISRNNIHSIIDRLPIYRKEKILFLEGYVLKEKLIYLNKLIYF